MARWLAMASFNHSSGLPKDRVVNTFAFRPTGDDRDNVVDMLEDFYFNEHGGATFNSIWNNMSRRLVGPLNVKLYDIDDDPPRIPIFEDSREAPSRPAATGNFPEEVALVMSFQAVQQSGTVQARRRGRVYLGPLVLNAGDLGPTADPRPSPTFMGVVQAAGTALLEASNSGINHNPWAVWSRVSNLFVDVDNGWVDDAFDTQRRRGLAATSRLIIPTPA